MANNIGQITAAKQESPTQLLREFYASKGIDMDQPMQKSLRRITSEEKNRQHEEWHRNFENFVKQRQ